MRSPSFGSYLENRNKVVSQSQGTARSTRTPDRTLHYQSLVDDDVMADDSISGRCPGPMIIDGHFEWEVEAVLAVRAGARDPEFLVKWAGWPFNASTWEPLENLTHCKDTLNDFYELLNDHEDLYCGKLDVAHEAMHE